jgi:hypothetical protein
VRRLPTCRAVIGAANNNINNNNNHIDGGDGDDVSGGGDGASLTGIAAATAPADAVADDTAGDARCREHVVFTFT